MQPQGLRLCQLEALVQQVQACKIDVERRIRKKEAELHALIRRSLLISHLRRRTGSRPVRKDAHSESRGKAQSALSDELTVAGILSALREKAPISRSPSRPAPSSPRSAPSSQTGMRGAKVRWIAQPTNSVDSGGALWFDRKDSEGELKEEGRDGIQLTQSPPKDGAAQSIECHGGPLQRYHETEPLPAEESIVCHLTAAYRPTEQAMRIWPSAPKHPKHVLPPVASASIPSGPAPQRLFFRSLQIGPVSISTSSLRRAITAPRHALCLLNPLAPTFTLASGRVNAAEGDAETGRAMPSCELPRSTCCCVASDTVGLECDGAHDSGTPGSSKAPDPASMNLSRITVGTTALDSSFTEPSQGGIGYLLRRSLPKVEVERGFPPIESEENVGADAIAGAAACHSVVAIPRCLGESYSFSKPPMAEQSPLESITARVSASRRVARVRFSSERLQATSVAVPAPLSVGENGGLGSAAGSRPTEVRSPHPTLIAKAGLAAVLGSSEASGAEWKCRAEPSRMGTVDDTCATHKQLFGAGEVSLAIAAARQPPRGRPQKRVRPVTTVSSHPAAPSLDGSAERPSGECPSSSGEYFLISFCGSTKSEPPPPRCSGHSATAVAHGAWEAKRNGLRRTEPRQVAFSPLSRLPVPGKATFQPGRAGLLHAGSGLHSGTDAKVNWSGLSAASPPSRRSRSKFDTRADAFADASKAWLLRQERQRKRGIAPHEAATA